MDTSERRAQVRQMVLDGVSQRNIAGQLGVHKTTVRNDVRELRKEGLLPPARTAPPGRSTTIKSVLQPTHRRAAAHPATVDRALMAQMRAKAFDMKAGGMSLRAIAEEFKRDVHTIGDWIQAEIEQLIVPKINHLRKMEDQRLDSYLVALEPKIKRGDDKAINAALRVSERRAKLWGMDAPTKVDATVYEVDAADREIAELINEAKAAELNQPAETADDRPSDPNPGA